MSLLSCSHQDKSEFNVVDLDKVQEKIVSEIIHIPRGEIIRLEKVLPEEYFQVDFNIECRDKKIPYYKNNKTVIFFLSESYFSDFNPYRCTLNVEDLKKSVTIYSIIVNDASYPSEKLDVDQKRITLSQKDLQRVQDEQKILNAIYSNGMNYPLFKSGFRRPLNSSITSVYGTQRVFNDLKKTQHLGVDFRARKPMEIKNAGSGKVVLATNLFYTGNTVIVDHGLGIFTIYGHLSKVNVNVGDLLPKGHVLGLTGKTGRVTGPHLHWGVKVHQEWINGLSLVEEGIL